MADSKKYDGSQWKHSLRKLTTATEIVENPLYSDGTAITSYTIKGNTVQNGTPTPSSPVDVNGVGVRTENLAPNIGWVDGFIGPNGSVLPADAVRLEKSSDFIPIQSGISLAYSYRGNSFPVGSGDVAWRGIGLYKSDKTFISRLAGAGTSTYVAQVPDNAAYIRLSLRTFGQEATPNVMLNSGSTAKPYEPYGYKIPISSDDVTTNIYLSEPLYKIGEYADTINSNGTVTRKIKKIIFNGTENWSGDNTKTHYLQDIITNYPHETKLICCCSHYNGTTNIQIGATISDGAATFLVEMNILYLKGFEVSTLSDFKQFLADQYVAGTPVTLWYVLETPTTESVTAPSIPTTEGANSITVDTTVQPSEFTATWTGWHNANVKEWGGSQWNE